ncbi:MAG: hypothetical protein PSU94_10565 [Lacunisphaera sp.]|nr:hypothetical protein [Lacunisphaera sp.]
MDYLDTKRFDRLSDDEVLDRIGTLLAVAIGRHEQQLAALVGASQAAPVGDPDLAVLDLTQLVTDPLEAQIIMHLRVAGRTNAREVAVALGLNTSAAAQKLARLCAAGLCRVETSSRPACYRLRTEYSAN